ncbi:MAG: type I polyketide synthase [Beijerinckiaceae bacterium]|nr:type I polyketide synthase [Beijerinckiaceae bacterium]
MIDLKDIAVVGRSCRLPGAPSVEALWALLSAGRCAVTEIPEDRWSLERLLHPRLERGRTYTWSAGVLDNIWDFDPGAFGLSPREAEQMDPQQRLLLELVWEALEDAGIRPSAIAGSEAGVFVGASSVDHANLRMVDIASADAYMMTGNTLSIISNRISYIFDLHGPSFTLDTACSSSLVALNEAVVNLRAGRIDTAIVAGVNLLVSPYSFVGFSQASMLSRRGLCQAFSKNADGYVRAEGGAVLVLRTREAAESAGDRIHGLLVGADVNSDGRTNGISLPSKSFQAELLHKLYVARGLDLDRLAFVEAHGTGTPVGDPIEATAIGETLAIKRREPLLIGSVKTNIGHMEPASGLGGVLKAMLALEHDVLPPSLHADELTPHIDFEALNLRVAREPTPLPRVDGQPRLAGVNSFGFGGTNAHVVIADAPATTATATIETPASFLVLSAHSRGALAALASDYAARLEAADRPTADLVISAAAHRRDRLPHRAVVPLGDAEPSAIAAILDRICDEEQEPVGAARGTAVERDAPVAFVFSGNGSQFAGMGLAAYRHNEAFRAEIESISRDFAAIAGWSIVEKLHADDLKQSLELTQIAQPLLYAIQAAAVHALAAKGLRPGIVLGHSVGEVAAAEAAGILDRAGALQTIFSRSLHQELTAGQGGMAVLIGSIETTRAVLEELPDLEIACYNSPRAFTIAGDTADIDELAGVARRHNARIRKLDLAYPFHSRLMAPVERPLLQSLRDLPHRDATKATFISSVTGAPMDGAAMTGAYWWQNVREPVRFSAAVAAAAGAGAFVFVEIGPSPTLLTHIADSIDERAATVATLPVMDKRDKGKGLDPIANAVATAIARGARVDEAVAFGSGPASGTKVALPHYPWQRRTYRVSETTESRSFVRPGAWHPLIGARYGADQLEWHSSLDTELYPWLADHCVDGRAILPGAAFAEMALAVARDWLGTEQATIADLEITSPMQLTPDVAREVCCRLSPHVGHLEILSRPRLGGSTWQPHATAKIFRDTSVGRLPEPDDHAPLSPSHPVTGAEIYAMAERAGLKYGPTFQKLETAAAVRPDRIQLGLTKDEANPAFGIDPARMDACFHALVLIFSSLREAVHGNAYIPVRFGEIMLRRPGVTFTKARIDVLRRDERIIIANFILTDEAGDIVVFMREARFQAIRTSRGADTGRVTVYQTSQLASEPTARRGQPMLTLADFRRAVGAVTATGMSDDFVLLDGWATSLALRTARELATANFIDVEALVASGRLPAKAKPWLKDVLVALDRSGLCHRDKLGHHIDPEIELPDPDEILRTIANEHQNLSAELLLAASTVAAIDQIVAGEGDVPRPLSTKVVDGFEMGASQVQAGAAHLIRLVRASLPAWPTDRALRVLQVGFGPLTNLAVAFADSCQAELTVLDPDRRRLERAKISLAERGDVAFVEKIEDLPPAGFDFVIAAHALYRHHRMPGFWAGLRRAMARDALFAAVEPCPSFFRDLVFGLDARFAEGDAVADGLSVSEADWLEAMQSVGLSDAEVSTVETAVGTSLLLTARVESARAAAQGAGAALLVGDDEQGSGATISAFATLLAAAGLHVSLVLDSELEPSRLAEVPALIVLFPQDAGSTAAPTKRLLDRCLRLKRLADCIGPRAATVWIVTSGAVTARETGDDEIAAGFWAFTRTLANEMPTLDIRRVDVADGIEPERLSDRLRDLILSGTDETEVLLERTQTRVVRFETAPVHERRHARPAEAARLRRGDGTGFDRLNWEAAARQQPGPGDVEIKVEAIGLNFRDVMFGLGLLPEEILEHGFAGPTLGLECAGRVERVGAAVKLFKPGDRVMAFAKSAFATHVTTPAAVVAPIPRDLAMETAATIPVAFLTAYHGLMICARLKPGEWVLIHGGAGGVGLAAIQIARWRGARVIATAGSPERRTLLASLGAEHVFDSRSGAFIEDVRSVTGEGVAVVLNSLAGEAMERSIGVLRPFGRFVELGKRDYVANTHIGLRPFRRNLSYFGVDLDQLLIDEPATSKLLMRSVMRLFASGDLAPLPYRAFDAAETGEAFRQMQASGHVGKLVVRPPRPADVCVRHRRAFQVAPDKMHVITGGFGGFGLETAKWLAAKGARNLMLIGRSGAASSEASEAVASLTAQGVRVRAEALDIADLPALTRLFARFGRDLPALGGIIHAAMVLDDSLVQNITGERMERVLRPKVAGADNLDQLTRGLKLDYFVMYSSATTLIGNPGQAAYVAANGYMEGLARRRRRAGLPALAIAWGAIEDVGVLARAEGTRDALLARAGIKGMLAQDALRLMGDALAAPAGDIDDAVVAIAPIKWGAARRHLKVLESSAYAKLSGQDEAAAETGDKIDVAALLAGSSPDEARKTISDLIVDEIARVLRLPREDVGRATPLAEIGLDSLMAVELALGLEQRFTLNAPLSTSASSFSVNELVDHIIGLATGALSEDQALKQAMVDRHLAGATVAEIDEEQVMEKVRTMKGVLH